MTDLVLVAIKIIPQAEFEKKCKNASSLVMAMRHFFML